MNQSPTRLNHILVSLESTSLVEYSRVPIAFEVDEVLDVGPGPDGSGYALSSRALATPYAKDYDAIGRESPLHWAERFDISNWGFFAAFSAGKRVGGAAIARDTPSLDLLEGRSDLAVLWDIRVAPAARRTGVGSVLFGAAAAWASSRGCRELKVETQNINPAACRFYARMGCELRTVRRAAYPEFPDEIQLLWWKQLAERVAGEAPHA
jgi:GNAT superfamily N-acetyltransferase